MIHTGDCLEVMAGMPADSVDAVVTDPPYGLPGGFMGKSWDRFAGKEDAGFAYWLAGLIDGEGHFAVKRHSRGTHAPYFALKMRADEEGTLRGIHRHLRVGTITHEEREPNPMVKWVVQDKEGCQRLVDLLDKYPLRAKKRLDYGIWREAVCEWTDRPRGNRWHGGTDNGRMEHLRERLMAVRRYVEPAWSGNEYQDWSRLWGTEAIRVLKPGGWLLAFGGTRAYHRMTVGLEDAGFEIRDELTWIYASGFPKGRANLKPAHEPIVLARKPGPLRALNIDECRIGVDGGGGNGLGSHFGGVTIPKVQHGEDSVGSVGRWPSNLLLSDPELFDVANPGVVGSGATQAGSFYSGPRKTDTAKWTGVYSDDGGTATGQPGYGDSGGYSRFFKIPHRHDWWCEDDSGRCEEDAAGDDEGDFDAEPEPDGIDPEHPKAFIIPKADRADREPVLRGQLEATALRTMGDGAGEWSQHGPDNENLRRENSHPTVKPTDLMRHLVRLVTPQGGTVLDCFLGSGSTAIACELEGFPWLGIEQDPGYVAIAEARLNGVQRGLGLAI